MTTRKLVLGCLTMMLASGCGSSGAPTTIDARPGAVDAQPPVDAMLQLDAMLESDGGPGVGGVDPNGTDHQFVIARIFMPTTMAEANMFGLDLDGDSVGRPDNALGQILATLAGQAGAMFDLQATNDDHLRRGDILLLANVKAVSLTSAAGVGTSIHLGANPSIAPCIDANDLVCGQHLNGTASFEIEPTAPIHPPLLGETMGGRLTGGPGVVTIALSLVQGEAPQMLDLVGARVDVGVISDTGMMQGRLGGALTEAEVQSKFVPALHATVSNTIAQDCAGISAPCCEAGSSGEMLVELFDASEPLDCVVTLQELQSSSAIMSLVAPDVDLFDGDPADGNFAPRTDGIKDCLSLGLGFEATSAVFTPQ